MTLVDIVKQVIVDNHIGRGVVLLGDSISNPYAYGIYRPVRGIEYAWATSLIDAAVAGGVTFYKTGNDVETITAMVAGLAFGYLCTRLTRIRKGNRVKKPQ